MKIKGYEEITEGEFNKSGSNNVAYFSDLKTNKTYHFKIIQEFPIVFEDETRTIQLTKDGIFIHDKISHEEIYCDYNESFPLLVKAVKKAQEVNK